MAAGDMKDHVVKRATQLTTDATQTVVTALTYTVPADLRVVYARVWGFCSRLNNAIGTPVNNAIWEERWLFRRYDADAQSAGLAAVEQNSTLSAPGSSGYALDLNVSSNDIRVRVTGVASHNVRWELRAEYWVIEETLDKAAAA